MKLFPIILLIVLSAGCKHASKNNQIERIQIAMAGGWGDGQRIISIDTSFRYVFYGGGTNKKIYFKKGYFEGRINESFWDTLNIKFKKEKFDTLSNPSDDNVADASAIELIINWKNNTKKKIKFDVKFHDDTVRANLIWLLESCKTVELRPTKAFLFETTLQNPLQLPPIPKGLKFASKHKKVRR